MALPIKHTISLSDSHNMTSVVDKSVYIKPVGDSPKYHVWCSCQWEGWTHDLQTAHRFVNSHKGAQLARGNIVEVNIPAGLELTQVVLVQTSKVDDPKVEMIDLPGDQQVPVPPGVPVVDISKDEEIIKEASEQAIYTTGPELTQYHPDGNEANKINVKTKVASKKSVVVKSE